MDEQTRSFELSAASRGINFETFRRMAEAVAALAMLASGAI
jgi:hypothetical protein